MFEEYGRTREFHTILEIAESLREEFGTGIDAHPGSATVEAGQVNRTFRIVANRILKAIVADEGELRGLLTWSLRRAALDRLAVVDVSGEVAVTLLDLEPGLGDSWYAYLALAPETIILALVEETEPDWPSPIAKRKVSWLPVRSPWSLEWTEKTSKNSRSRPIE